MSGKIAVVLGGRMGNQMFQITNGMYLKKKYPEKEVFFTFESRNYIPSFNALNSFIEQPYNAIYLRDYQSYKVIDDINPTGFQEYEDMIDGNFKLGGFWQSELYWNGDEEFARNLFIPKPDIIERMKDRYSELGEFVTIHIRRTDYIGNGCIGTLSKKWYEDRIDSFSADTKFIFVSDDIHWCMDNFKSDRFFFNGGNVIEDFLIQTISSGNIISNSSYSWWAAYLNRNTKRVCCPAQWFDETKRKGQVEKIYPHNKKWEFFDKI